MDNYSKYLMSTSLERQWGMYLTTVGHTTIGAMQDYPQNTSHPETHAFDWNTGRILDGFYLVYITAGTGIFESAKSAPRTVKKGDCFLLFPGIWHRYKPNSTVGWEEYWIGFNGSYVNALMSAFFPPDLPVFQLGLDERFLRLLIDISTTVKQGLAGYHQIISGMALQLLGMLRAGSLTQNSISVTESLINDAKFLLRETIQENKPINEIINSLPASYSKIRKDFKTVTGLSPNQYRLELRLDKAKELIHQTVLDLKEIAYKTGFESASYLSKAFKKKYGIPPSELRKA